MALKEIHALGEFMANQRRRADGIAQGAADFLAWHPELKSSAEVGAELCVTVGTRQGFCGDLTQEIEILPLVGDAQQSARTNGA